ncbi:MAG: rnhA operon protein [Halodesulfurarchaeum sp.]
MPELPDHVLETAKAFTRAARRGTHPDGTALRERRGELLDEYGYTARVREDDSGPVLVCHPADWVEDGVLQPDAMDATENAVERPLRGTAVGDGWAAIDAHNRDLAGRVADRYGEPHGANAEAFAVYMANHHAEPIEAATSGQVRDFLEEYFPRNAWPDEAQAAVVETSIERLFAVAGEPMPLDIDE